MAMQLAIYTPRDGSMIYAVMDDGLRMVSYNKERHCFLHAGFQVVHFSHWFNRNDPELMLSNEAFELKYGTFGGYIVT